MRRRRPSRAAPYEPSAFGRIPDIPAGRRQLVPQAVGPPEVARGARLLALRRPALDLLRGLLVASLEQALQPERVQHLPQPARAEALARVHAAVGFGHPLEQDT